MSADLRNPVLLIGLGRFGIAVGTALERMGHEVLAIESDPRLVAMHKDELTQVVEGDATDSEVLDQLGVRDFEAAVVAIGTDVEASVLAVLALTDLGIGNIWAKATSERHGRILERTGAHHIVFPEQKMGERVARLLNERLVDFIGFDDDFSIARLLAPEPVVGVPLMTSQCRRKFDVTVVGVKRAGEPFIHATPETLIMPGDELVVSGKVADIEAFSALR